MPLIKECMVLVIGGSSRISYGVMEKYLLENIKIYIISSNTSWVGKTKLVLWFLNAGPKLSLTLIMEAGSEKSFPNWLLVGGYLTISSGMIATLFWESGGVLDNMKDTIILGKVGMIEEVAEVYVYLIKDTNTTGVCISTNAGSLLL
ncbi:hypothetical protein ASPNIDRAFT_125283 [Aspergillus niger ATCC 1015]|uniref:Uncharacterized protein n=1 Tax=Aspergillus niger (strain ATCC 1015 / CBS 113.46 / FGSC A1144 / LSHB Ac4 / NCTC 3858a / NRRL 328 / USDA 3528.7) TaxID=380704 RepID=G3XWV6_ASPNA|nr:hypothetical protein ASPNIDRAFT_125283 [Aspergillus niger ATCC 1015]